MLGELEDELGMLGAELGELGELELGMLGAEDDEEELDVL
jgi:hypothetical protein